MSDKERIAWELIGVWFLIYVVFGILLYVMNRQFPY